MINKNNKILHAIVFLTVAVVLSLAAGETTLRFVSDHVLIYNIEMLKYGNQLKMRDPLNEISHVHRPNSSARLMGVDISLNSLGNRSRELVTPKPAGEKRVYVAGSSVTMGWGVAEHQVFTYMAEEKLNQSGVNKYNLINAGVGNYGTSSSAKIFYRQFEKTNPDMFVLHYFIADVEPRDLRRDNSFLQSTYLGAYIYNDIQGLIFKNSYGSMFDYYDRLYSDDSAAWKQTLQDIFQLKKFLNDRKIPFLIVIVPDFYNLSEGTPYQALYQKMQLAFESMNIKTLNTFPEFQKRYSGHESVLWVQPNDPHPNAVGHRLMADLLYDYFLKNITPGAGL